MRIPVIMALLSQEPLQESASSAQTTEPKGIVAGTKYPLAVAIDPIFSAVPIGSGRPEIETLDTMTPGASAKFAVRGEVEVDSIDDIPTEQEGAQLFADPQIEPFLTCGGDPAVGDQNDVAMGLNLPALHQAGLDGEDVAVAILDTGINVTHLQNKLGMMPRFDAANSWTPPGLAGSPGQHPVDHGTMCAFDALIAAPKATLLDFPVLLSAAPGGSVMGRRLSLALLGFAQLLAFWGVAFAPGGANKYKALIVNNSWGMFHPSWDFPPGHPGRYADNPNHPFNVIVSTLARSNADILFAAGNCGGDCPDGRCQNVITDTITGANALSDVLTVAGCDKADQRVGYSSQGPAIAGMANEKPDITAYTHFKGSEAFGTNSPDSGTSAACPVAAGCVAALRTSANPTNTPPPNLFAQLRLTARQIQGTGWNRDYGCGIIDPVTAAQSLGLMAST
jgi:subtilisin family serine protease